MTTDGGTIAPPDGVIRKAALLRAEAPPAELMSPDSKAATAADW